MTSQINGFNQAAQNANDGVSLTQTASGALSEVTNDLQTMRDLAVESLNATNSAGDRADLNAQYQQLAADINSVASPTAVQRREPARRLVPGRDLPGRRQRRPDHQVASSQAPRPTTSVSCTRLSDPGYLCAYALPMPTATSSTGTLTVTSGSGATAKYLDGHPVTLTGNQATDLSASLCDQPVPSARPRARCDGGLVRHRHRLSTTLGGLTGGADHRQGHRTLTDRPVHRNRRRVGPGIQSARHRLSRNPPDATADLSTQRA